MDINARKEKAMNYFTEGYNCSQAVVLAFQDMLDMDEETLAKVSMSFGGGMGRLREVCGTVTGMFMVLGLYYGTDDPKDFEGKSEHYKRVQEVAKEFEKMNGSIICRELLGLDVKREDPQSSERTKEFYKKRPCKDLVGDATEILARYIEEHDK